jgi:predicted site-specific integrase-resolvase
MEVKFTDYMTAAEAAEQWGVHIRVVQRYCATGKIPGSINAHGRWFIPRDVNKPVDGRVNNRRLPKKKIDANTAES